MICRQLQPAGTMILQHSASVGNATGFFQTEMKHSLNLVSPNVVTIIILSSDDNPFVLVLTRHACKQQTGGHDLTCKLLLSSQGKSVQAGRDFLVLLQKEANRGYAPQNKQLWTEVNLSVRCLPNFGNPVDRLARSIFQQQATVPSLANCHVLSSHARSVCHRQAVVASNNTEQSDCTRFRTKPHINCQSAIQTPSSEN